MIINSRRSSASRLKVTLCCMLVALPWLAGSAHAGVFSIPTADEGKAGDVSVSVDSEGEGLHLGGGQTLHVLTAEYGITRRLQVGTDALLSGDNDGHSRVLPNVSVLLTPRDSRVRVALGYANVGLRGFSEQAFVVASGDVAHFTLHGGFTRTQGRSYPMLGVERPLTHALTAQADYVAGEGNFLSVGGQLQVAKHLSLGAAWMIANRHADDNGLYLSAQYSS